MTFIYVILKKNCKNYFIIIQKNIFHSTLGGDNKCDKKNRAPTRGTA